MNAYVELYRKLAKYGDLVCAKFASGKKCAAEPLIISAKWSYRNISRKNRSKLESKYIKANEHFVKFSSSPVDGDIILEDTNNNGDNAYILQNKENCSLFLNYQSGESSNLNLKELDLHGKVYSSESMSSFCWSSDSSKIAYIAQKKLPKASSFFSEKNGDEEGKGEENAYVDDYGEKMEGYREGVIAIVNVADLSVEILEIPKEYDVTYVNWSDSGYIIGVCYQKTAYRLGMIYCPNRPSILFKIDMDGNFTELTPSGFHVTTPRISPDGKKIVFVRCPTYGPHVRIAQLCKLDLATNQITVIIDYASEADKDNFSNEFYGIDSDCSIPKHCWLSDSSVMFLTTKNNFENVILMVNTESKLVAVVPSTYSQHVFDVSDKYLLIEKSSFATRPELHLLEPDPSYVNPKYIRINEEGNVPGLKENWIHKRSIQVPHPVPEAARIPVPYFYIGPDSSEEKKRPVIVLPHGGPHSAFMNSYYMAITFYINLGYSVIIPNYRGSLGQGSIALESLPGHVGRADVDDCHHCVKHAFKEFGSSIDENRIFLSGGSHGGFLVAHLSAQFPDVYKVVVSRNPVINIAAMYSSTDIPDWTVVESGFDYAMGKIPDNEVISAMYNVSPYKISQNILAPTLFLLGKNDRRVPHEQGLKLHKKLLSLGVPTKAYIYDDCHALSKVDVEAECLVHQANWFETYGSSKA